ncbi:hypothetical protein LOTGIDRAFT_171709 [Lottia gigantea]|uniref:Uncharacterized protein n=1 Tax=Lottia gigantea TaxID=225164 RepID=V4BB33_LOTGI|nr:hypothetical protein LOTGIDRAFT_171709 [Lottia gigantea]ESP03222.1 hypothetical protein LOTGIDRAFT_171709 [Lottia gigantea]
MDTYTNYQELSARTAGDGCESYKTAEEMDMSFDDAGQFIRVMHYDTIRPVVESQNRRKDVDWNLEWFKMKRASLKRKEGLLFEKHRRIKKKLHDFLNFASKKEAAMNSENTPSTPNYKSRSQLEQSSHDTGLVTVLKNGIEKKASVHVK